MLGVLLASAAIVAGAGTAAAHTPHDDIFDVAVSPTYVTDQTVFVISRRHPPEEHKWRGDVEAHRQRNRQQGGSHRGNVDSDQRILYVSSPRDGVYRSRDAGASWSKVGRGLPTNQIATLALSPHSDNVLYATGVHGGLFRTVDGGERWAAVAGFDVRVTAIVFAGDVGDAVFVGDDRGTLHRSRDGGTTWERQPIERAGRIRAIGASPNYSVDKTVFVGTDAGGSPRE